MSTNTASSELPKTYDPSAVEPEAFRVWVESGSFHAEPSAPGEPYAIVIPPPNVTGALHLGHAINNTLQDILIRRARMQGKNAMWMPGIDHAGIATQAVVEKQLKEKENKTRHDVGREGLVERIWQWKEQYGDRIVTQLKKMGCSCDWDRTRFTLDEVCAKAVRETFFKLFKDGLIYRGKRLVNWDVHLQTSISDDEIYHETVKTSLWHIRYPIVDGEAGGGQQAAGGEQPLKQHGDALLTGTGSRQGGGQVAEQPHPSHPRPLAAGETESAEPRKAHGDALLTGTGSRHGGGDVAPSGGAGVSPAQVNLGPGARATHMVVATTRPETLLGDTAVAVHSQDPRWNWAIGKFVKLPLTGRLIPIIADDVLVDPKFGSGVVKVTPAHDPNDYAVWQRHQGQADQIDIINILNSDGTLNENAGAYKGMKRDAARKKVVEDLESQGLLEKTEPHETQVGHSDRSKTAVEPYLSDQWFVKMAPLAEPALEVVRNGTIKFFPERHAQQYLSWLGEKRDWPISRQLWWGHRIPVWSRRFDQQEFESLGENHPIVTEIFGNCALGYAAHSFQPTEGGLIVHICPRLDFAEFKQLLETHGFTQDPDVLDTWFSSALWPHSTLGWPEQTDALRKWYPGSVLLTGRDIITLWVARMVMTGLYNLNDIPFAHVAINPTILDGKGERMSKSKGNGVDPVDIIDTHGADALRFTLTTMATETQDVRMPVKKLPDGRNTSDKFDLGRNFCNKLWNASRFVLSTLAGLPNSVGQASDASTSLPDRWIVSRFNRAVAECDSALESYRFDQYARACYDFFWRDFCDWYVEASKGAMKDPARAGATGRVLTEMLDASLRLMHPIIPFITETIWWKLADVREPSSELLIKAPWPKAGAVDEVAEAEFARLQEIVGAIRNVRNEYKVDPKKIVPVSISAPAELATLVAGNRETIELLATCTLKDARSDLAAPANSARALVAGAEVFVENLIDPEAEKQRVEKKRGELTKQIAAMKGRLSNDSYISKAPAHLVEQTRQQLADAEGELAKLG